MPEFFDILTYDTEKAIDVLDIGDVYEDIVVLTTPLREEGLYEFKFSLVGTLATTTKAMFFQWRIDGGDWFEIQSEPKDVDDKKTVDYFFPVRFADPGVHVIELQGRKESGSAQMDVLFADLVLHRVGI